MVFASTGSGLLVIAYYDKFTNDKDRDMSDTTEGAGSLFIREYYIIRKSEPVHANSK